MNIYKLILTITILSSITIIIFNIHAQKDNPSEYEKLIEVLQIADKYNNTDTDIADVEYKNITYYIFTESQINLIGEKGCFNIEK